MKTMNASLFFDRGICRIFHNHYRNAIILFVTLFILKNISTAQTQISTTNKPLSLKEITSEGERLRASIDFVKFKNDIISVTKMSYSDYDLFYKFIADKWISEEIDFFQKVRNGLITESNLAQYLEELKQSYILQYENFLKIKKELLLQTATDNNRVLVANGPCTNIGFEDGTFNGWEGFTGTHEDPPTNDPVNPVANFSLMCIMSAGMTDPLIPTLPVVAPGSIHSVRLGNTVNGGHAAKMQQTFKVDSSNMIFTYRYAVVLEDPQDHSDGERPYFKIRLYDSNNQEISCASYTVVVRAGLEGFTHVCVDADGAGRSGTPVNVGCPPNQINTTSGNSIPGPGGCGNNVLDIYYKSWTTVSIPLNAYYGQNVRVEFTSADCEPNGHLGYAYIDAECTPFVLSVPNTICSSGNETGTLSAPAGFASYAWTGPGIVGSTNTQSITVNRGGTYQVILTPVSDNPCLVTLNVYVKENCPPPPITVTLCEGVAASGSSEVNLNDYNSQVTASRTPPGTVLSWHTARPVSSANKISTPTTVTVSNGTSVYALIQHANIPSDTIQVNFVINPKPVINFPAIPVSCEGASSFQITGITPAGGIFSGVNVTSEGIFNPVAAGSYSINYNFINAEGCSNSANQTAVVKALPTPDTGPDKTVCIGTATTVSTPQLSDEKYAWTNLQGNLVGTGNSLSIMVNTDSTLILTVTDKFYCVSSDTIGIDAVPLPIVRVEDTSMCQGESLVLKGTVVNSTDIQSYNPVYQWQKDKVSMGGNSTSLTVNAAGVYTLIVTVQYGCSGEGNAHVVIHPSPKMNMVPLVKFCEDTATSISLDAGQGFKFFWQPGNDTTRYVNVSLPGIYTATVTNQYNCSSSGQTMVRSVCPPRIFIGNAFSPDNDGTNDLYNVYGAHIGRYHMLIFNRWGEIIFESNERTNYWDGMYRGELMPIGVYPWIITYEGDTEEYKGPYKLEGSVTIIR